MSLADGSVDLEECETPFFSTEPRFEASAFQGLLDRVVSLTQAPPVTRDDTSGELFDFNSIIISVTKEVFVLFKDRDP